MSGGARGPQSQEEKGVALIEMREKRVVLIEKQRSRRLYVHGCSAPNSGRHENYGEVMHSKSCEVITN